VEIGVYIRDDQRSFVLAKTKWFTPKIHVDVDKALGLLSGLTWVQELQLGIVDFVSCFLLGLVGQGYPP
jgi:hypothetical protein